jgi:sugar phosphate isomerase/epimerase
MTPTPITDLSRLCIHTITNRPWSIEDIARHYSAAGVAGISVWREAVAGRDKLKIGRMLRDSGLTIVSYVRGGFFPASDKAGRHEAIEENKKIIDEAADLGAPLVVLVCGALPGQPLEESRKQIRDGIAAIVPHAETARVKLGIEPLHPMYTADRSAVNTLKQANDMAELLASDTVGIVHDVYHLWWDPDLKKETKRCGSNEKLWAFHISDWKIPTEDLLQDRGLMGEGCIDIKTIRGWVETAGFEGFHEVEIFSKKYWTIEQTEFLNGIVKAYLKAT